jgi:hypothetical protein
MITLTRNGSTAPTPKFIQRNTEETLAELNRPIDPRHFKTRKVGAKPRGTTFSRYGFSFRPAGKHGQETSWRVER